MTGSLDPLLAELCNTEVKLYRATRDAYGKPTYTLQATFDAHIQINASQVSGVEGQDVDSDTIVWSPTIVNADPATDVIELPNGDRPRMVAARLSYDENGDVHHEKIFLTRERV